MVKLISRSNGSKLKFHFTRWGIIALAVVLALGSVGVTYAKWKGKVPRHNDVVYTYYFNDPFTWVVSNDDGTPDTVSPYGVIDPGDNGDDPSEPQSQGVTCARYGKDVASTDALLNVGFDPRHITVTVSNAYPCYYPTIFFGMKNCAHVAAQIESIVVDENFTGEYDTTADDIDALDVTYGGIYVGQVIGSGTEVIGNLHIHVEQPAKENWTYKIRVKIIVKAECQCGGTPGYWHNWKQHYTAGEINGWLTAIDVASGGVGSGWLVSDMAEPYGTIDTADLDAILAAGVGGGATAESRFLRHYLATRLNAQAEPPTLYLGDTHDITSISGYEYLGLSNPASAKLSEIIAAIESKYGTSLTDNQYNIMKNICDALNNCRI